MKLTDLSDTQIINILIRTNSNDASTFRNQIESAGFELISSFGNKATLRGPVKAINAIADLDFVEYLEIGMGLASE
jgi:hypothetical protein